MKNRRNFYRILQVQPDASSAVIKASYRTLMQTLKLHPDLGGDHWNAALINEAYSTLSNLEKRTAYDKDLLHHYVKNDSLTDNRIKHFCVFCKTPHDKTLHAHAICVECHSPLFLDDSVGKLAKRGAMRFKKEETLTYYLQWPKPFFSAKMADLSPQGVCFLAPTSLLENQVIRLESPLFLAIARVCHCGVVRGVTDDKKYRVGAAFLTIVFEKKSGNFLSLNA